MARQFNGTSDFLASAATVNLSGLNKISVTACLKITFLGNAHQFLLDSTTLQMNVASPGSGPFVVTNTLLGTVIVGYRPQPSPGYWHSIGASIDRSQASASAIIQYLDGVQQGGTVIAPGTPGGNFGNSVISFMATRTPSFFLPGSVCRIAIHNRVLTPAEFAAIASGADPTTISGCIHYWPITGASPELDTVGSNNLTVTGSTVVSDPTFPLPIDHKSPKGIRFFLDNFDGTINTDLRVHTPDQGSPWLAANAWPNIWALSGSSTAKLSANNQLIRAYVNQNQPGNCIVSGNWFFQDTANSDQTIIFRYQASPEKFYFLTFSDTEGKIVLRRSDVGGVLTRLSEVPYDSFFESGQTSQFEPWEVHVLGKVTKFYHGNSLKLYWDDGNNGFTDAVRIGMQKTFDRPAPHTQFGFVQVNSLGGVLPQFLQSSPPFPALFDELAGYDEEEGNTLFCRQTLERFYTSRIVLANEKVWAYQIKREYCADWLFLSPGLLVDPAAASPVLNTGFGIRVYEVTAGKDDTWSASTGSATDKLGGTRPVWTQPAWYGGYIPWNGRPVDLLVELYTNGAVAPAAGSILELAVAAYKDIQV